MDTQAPDGALRDGDLLLNGTLRSGNCGLVMRIGAATTHMAEHYAKAVRYTACMTALTMLQVRVMRLITNLGSGATAPRCSCLRTRAGP